MKLGNDMRWIRLFSVVGAVFCGGILTKANEKTALSSDNNKYRRILVNDVEDECLAKVQEVLNSKVSVWYKNKVPVLSTVVPYGKGVKLVFSTVHIRFWDMYAPWSQDTYYYCEDGSSGKVMASDPHRRTIIIICDSFDGTKVFLRSANPLTEIRMEWSLVLPCRIPTYFEPSFLSACTMIKGRQRWLLPQWITYHHLIGIQHFYIYVNERFEGVKDFIKMFPTNSLVGPHVKFIPFDFEVKYPFFFQRAMQNDCIHRAAAADVKWMGLFDVDEYFQLHSDYKNLQEVLFRFTHMDIGGVQVKNWFFGNKDSKRDNNATTQLMFDMHCWRTPEPTKKGREKVFVQPKNIIYHSVHVASVGKPLVHPNPYQQIRMNHYKDAFNGVYGYNGQEKELVYDESLRLAYRDQTQLRLSALIKKTYKN